MRRLMMAHEEKGLVRVAMFEPVHGKVGDDVGDVALALNLFAVPDHWRVVIAALAGEDIPIIEAGWVSDQVPFADHGGLVPGGLQQFWKSGLRTVKAAIDIVVKA